MTSMIMTMMIWMMTCFLHSSNGSSSNYDVNDNHNNDVGNDILLHSSNENADDSTKRIKKIMLSSLL